MRLETGPTLKIAPSTLGFVVAADIGQAQDYTALAVLQSGLQPPAPSGRRTWRHDLRHIERFRDLTYPKVIDRIRQLLAAVEQERMKHLRATPARLVIDATGVGKPILDALQLAALPNVKGVIITAGNTVTHGSDGTIRVPKRELVTRLQLALQQQRLRIAANLPLADVLRRELAGYSVRVTVTGHERFGNDVTSWREADHDDLVLAVALAVWRQENSSAMTSEEIGGLYR